MWSSGSARLWRGAGGVTVPGPPAPAPGLAMTTLRSMIAYLAATIRCAVAVYIVVEVVIWHPFYFTPATAWRLAAPALAVAWAVTLTVRLRSRGPSAVLACADFAVLTGLALGARLWVPPEVRYDAYSWVVFALAAQVLVTAWFTSRELALPLVLIAPLAFLAGVAPAPAGQRRTMIGAAVVLLIAGLVHIMGRRVLYRRAALADAGLDQADRAARQRYAGLRRSIERREHERLVHDTVLNTLTALARGGDAKAAMVEVCRQDVDLIAAALGDVAGQEASAVAGPGALAGAVLAAAGRLRARGLTVHVEADDGAGAGLPVRVVAALGGATGEALANVARHAGTREAWVTVRRAGVPGSAGSAPCGVRVTVRDQGAGFDPQVNGTDVDGRVRLGLRRSIAERVAECGGQASVRSAPGRGTEVSLCWPDGDGLGVRQ